MPNNIFILHDKDGLVPLLAQEYESEAIFQAMLTNYPELLLFGDERTPYSNLLLIKQEKGIPIETNKGSYYYLDHLFIDQDGILTLIEIKRRGDTRSRREVIAQMFDYVTNGLAFWTIDEIKKSFEQTCQDKGENPDKVLINFLGERITSEEFWLLIESNIRSEKIRMVYVADHISPEMRRIIEFLSRQLRTVSICAIELRQFIGKNVKAFVPDVIGSEYSATERRISSELIRQWDEASFFEELMNRKPEVIPVANAILKWGKDNCDLLWWGKGKQTGSFAPIFLHNGMECCPTYIWSTGIGDIQFQYLQNLQPFDKEEYRIELMNRLNSIPGIDIPQTSLRRRPSFSLVSLIPLNSLNDFINILNWIVSDVKGSNK